MAFNNHSRVLFEAIQAYQIPMTMALYHYKYDVDKLPPILRRDLTLLEPIPKGYYEWTFSCSKNCKLTLNELERMEKNETNL